MKTLLICLASLFVTLPAFSQNDRSLAHAHQLNNRYVFLWSTPVQEYEVVFTFANLIDDYYCLSPAGIMDATLQNANAEAGNQNKLYDAVVCVNGSGRDMAIVWKDKTKDNSLARVITNGGKYVFVECDPIASYDVIGMYNVSGVAHQVLFGQCPTHEDKIDKLLKKGFKEKKGFDAVMYTSNKKDLSIKFK